jgi:hypothetical protein
MKKWFAEITKGMKVRSGILRAFCTSQITKIKILTNGTHNRHY